MTDQLIRRPAHLHGIMHMYGHVIHVLLPDRKISYLYDVQVAAETWHQEFASLVRPVGLRLAQGISGYNDLMMQQ